MSHANPASTECASGGVVRPIPNATAARMVALPPRVAPLFTVTVLAERVPLTFNRPLPLSTSLLMPLASPLTFIP